MKSSLVSAGVSLFIIRLMPDQAICLRIGRFVLNSVVYSVPGPHGDGERVGVAGVAELERLVLVGLVVGDLLRPAT